MNYTINEIPNTATEANDADFAVLYQGDKTKKISFQNLFNKARRNNIFITATNTTIAGPKLQAGDVIRVFFIAQQEGTDTTTAMALSYNDTSYNVKAPCNGSLKDFTANAITVETRELSKGAETEGEEKGETKSTRATSTAYVYCQAYTTLELLFDGTQFVIIGNPVVISSADYTIYTDGSKNHQIKRSTVSYSITSSDWQTSHYGLVHIDKDNIVDIIGQGRTIIGSWISYCSGWSGNISFVLDANNTIIRLIAPNAQVTANNISITIAYI